MALALFNKSLFQQQDILIYLSKLTLMEHYSNFCHLSQMSDEWIFPENHDHIPQLASSGQSLLLDDSCHTSRLWLEASNERDQQAEETQLVPKDIFTFSSRPRSAPHGKIQNMSPEGCPFVLDLKEDTIVTQLEDDCYDGDSSEEVHCLMGEIVLKHSCSISSSKYQN